MSSRPNCCGKPMRKFATTKEGRQRYMCGDPRRASGCGRTTTGTAEAPKEGPGYDVSAAAERAARLAGAKRFVVTAAQNNTATVPRFMRSLEAYCRERDAELIVIPIHYKNISLYTANQEYRKWWAPSVLPYIVDGRIDLGGGVQVAADISVAATAANPLEGKQSIGGRRSVIYGHPQLAMEPVATPAGKRPKRMYTTGACTQRSYSRTNAGAKAEFHHVTGALVVEVVGREAFVRQLNADSRGGFYDLDRYYKPDGSTGPHRVAALVPGDEHVKFHARNVRLATYDAPDSMTAVLRPERLIRHDMLDGYAGSHHHEGDDVLQFRKYWRRDHSYKAELEQLLRFLQETTPEDCENWVVPSNHHDHLYKWLMRVDPRRDPENALLIHELKDMQYRDALAGGDSDPLRLYLQRYLPEGFPIRFLDRSRPALVAGVDLSQHGDVGVNGSKGSARGLSKATYKMMIGHSHGARIVKGVYQVGKSTGRLEYEKGLGDHSQTHGVVYPNGKRALIDVIGNRWRG